MITELMLKYYDYILYLLLIVSFTALFIIKFLNKKTSKKIVDLKNSIKPFEIKIDKNAEKMIAVEKLTEGDVFSRDIFDEYKFKLYYKNMIVTNEMKNELIKKNIGFVWIKSRKFKGFE